MTDEIQFNRSLDAMMWSAMTHEEIRRLRVMVERAGWEQVQFGSNSVRPNSVRRFSNSAVRGHAYSLLEAYVITNKCIPNFLRAKWEEVTADYAERLLFKKGIPFHEGSNSNDHS